MATKPKPSMSPLEGGGPLQPAAAVILYNHRTGVIFSTHYFSTVDDAQLPDKDELERVALEHAAKDGCKVSTHKALHVDPAALKRGVGYRVAKGKLTEVKAGRLRPKALSASRSSTSR
jgi:hypothetical protein